MHWRMKERLLNGEVSLKIEFSGVQSMNDRASIRVQGGEQGEHIWSKTVQRPSSDHWRWLYSPTNFGDLGLTN